MFGSCNFHWSYEALEVVVRCIVALGLASASSQVMHSRCNDWATDGIFLLSWFWGMTIKFLTIKSKLLNSKGHSNNFSYRIKIFLFFNDNKSLIHYKTPDRNLYWYIIIRNDNKNNYENTFSFVSHVLTFICFYKVVNGLDISSSCSIIDLTHLESIISNKIKTERSTLNFKYVVV